MSDLISRQAAIDYCYALINAENPSDPSDEWNYSQERISQTEVILHHLEFMPSAQPEPTTEIQNILNYLDTVLHPIISPEHWNVYAELYDMISALPSAQRWISVTERLPEPDQYYLVTDDAGGMATVEVDKYIKCDDETEWLYSQNVTAWMPLPEPWRGEEDE